MSNRFQFGQIKKAIDSVRNAVKRLRDTLSNLKLPSWLTPGSPTPLEMGLRGINKELGNIGGSFNFTAEQGNGGGGGADNSAVIAAIETQTQQMFLINQELVQANN